MILLKCKLRACFVSEKFEALRKLNSFGISTSLSYLKAVVTVSRVLGRGFSPPLNPALENATCTLRTNTDSNEYWDLTRKARVVMSAINTHTCIHTYKSGCEKYFCCRKWNRGIIFWGNLFLNFSKIARLMPQTDSYRCLFLHAFNEAVLFVFSWTPRWTQLTWQCIGVRSGHWSYGKISWTDSAVATVVWFFFSTRFPLARTLWLRNATSLPILLMFSLLVSFFFLLHP